MLSGALTGCPKLTLALPDGYTAANSAVSGLRVGYWHDTP